MDYVVDGHYLTEVGSFGQREVVLEECVKGTCYVLVRLAKPQERRPNTPYNYDLPNVFHVHRRELKELPTHGPR